MPEMNTVACFMPLTVCDQRDCFVVQGNKQETNTGSKAKMPDHYRCTITSELCGKRKHYEDEGYHKQRLSAKLKAENASGKGSGKGNADKDSGKGKSKGNGKGQGGKGKGGRGGADRKPDKDKNADQSGGNPNPTPGGNSEPSGGQPNSGPTTRSQTQAQQEQGTKRAERKSHCHVFLGGLDPGQAPPQNPFVDAETNLSIFISLLKPKVHFLKVTRVVTLAPPMKFTPTTQLSGGIFLHGGYTEIK